MKLFNVAVKSHHYLSPTMHAIFIIGIISGQLSGMVKAFDKQNTDWNKIAIQSHITLSEIDIGLLPILDIIKTPHTITHHQRQAY